MGAAVAIGLPAPDFTLADFDGRPVALASFRGRRHVVLVFNRGFTWVFCQRHMAQLRRDHGEFTRRGAEIVVIGPEGPAGFRVYWEREKLPFTGLPDPDHTVLKLYGQQVRLFKLGRMPAQVIVDAAGVARWAHYGHSMADIPANADLLALLDELGPPGA